MEHCIAAKAVSFYEALQPEFVDYQKQVAANAQAMAGEFAARGYKVVSGGTDNHLMLVNLIKYEMTGKALEAALDAVNITCNKNTIPNDPKSPFVTSGVRLGSPAVTSRGFKEDDMDVVAEAIARTIKEGESSAADVKKLVEGLTSKYPLH